jgi:hypothetical protein
LFYYEKSKYSFKFEVDLTDFQASQYPVAAGPALLIDFFPSKQYTS